MCAFNTPFHPQPKQAFVRHLLLLRPKTREHTHFVSPPFLLFLLRPISPFSSSSSPFPEISPGNGGKRGEEKKIEKRSWLVHCLFGRPFLHPPCLGINDRHYWHSFPAQSHFLKRAGKDNLITFCPLSLFVGGPSDRLCKIRLRKEGEEEEEEEEEEGGRRPTSFSLLPLVNIVIQANSSSSSSKPFFPRKKGIAFLR